MNGTPRSTTDRPREGARSQSDLVAIVVLFGMVFLGAGVVILAGGMLVGNVQDTSQQQLAQDTAAQTQDQVHQALLTGEVREIPTDEMGSIDSRMVDDGSIRLEMYNRTSGNVCGEAVSEDLGAIVYETADAEVIYEAGAIWQRDESGISIQHTPGIDYDEEDGTEISLMSVDPGGEAGVIQPNVTARSETNRAVEEMLVSCPRAGRPGGAATSMRVTVDSPFADGWERHFEESMADSSNVDVSRSGDSVTANIENATDVLSEEWLWIRDHELESGLLTPSEDLEITTTVRNTGPRPANGTVTLEVAGEPALSTPSETVNLSSGQQQEVNLTIPSSELNSQTSSPTHDWYNYSVTVHQDDPADTDVATLTETIYFGPPQDELVVRGVESEPRDDGRFIDVRAAIHNIGYQDANETVELFVEDQAGNRGVIQPNPTTYADVNATQSGLVEFSLNTTLLGTGHYNAIVELDGGTEPNEVDDTWFEINNSIQAGGGNVTLGASGNATVSVMGTEVSAESIEDVSLPDHERPNTVLQHSQESMVGATYLEHQSGGPGWVPAERQNGSWVETGEAPDCSGGATEFDDDWEGWYVQDCWDDVEGFVWDDTDGYDFRWVMAGTTLLPGYAPGWPPRRNTVSRQDTNWAFRGVNDPSRDPSNQEYTKRWAPVTMEVVVDRPGGGTDRISLPDDTSSLDNLNTHDTQEREWTWEDTLTAGTELTLEGALWDCNYHSTHHRTDENGHEWTDSNCEDMDDRTINVDASQGENTENVQVLEDEDVLPELRAGYPGQRSADEVLNDRAEERINATTGELDLGENEAVFLFELTDRSATWQDAFEQEWLGDPNYNDAIVLFEYEPREEVIPLENASGIDGGDGTIPELDGDESAPGPGDSDPGSDVSVDVGHVVIG